MYDKDFKRFEDLMERTKQAYEFWYNCLVSSWKEFYKVGK